MIKQIEVSLFIFVTIFIFLYLQKMFIPSWNYPEFPDNVEDSIQGFMIYLKILFKFYF